MTHTLRRVAAFALVIAAALVLPSFAAAANPLVVNSTANGESQAICEAAGSGCTLRGAIKAANAATGSTIEFDGSLNGETIEVTGSPLEGIKVPTTLSGGSCPGGSGGSEPCVTVKGITGFAGLEVSAGVVVEGLAIEGGSPGIRVIGTGGAQILDNVITGSENGIETIDPGGVVANLIKGNEIRPSGPGSRAIALRNGPNLVVDNTIEGCNFASIVLDLAADGNKIGGDTPESENVINNSLENPVALFGLPETSHNEIARNRGTGNSQAFIYLQGSPNGGIQPPVISAALQSSISGTAKAGATVRVYTVQLEFNGEIESFVEEAEADSGGNWKVTFPKSAVGTSVSATQTLDGGTSVMSEVVNLAEESSGGGGGSGGGGTGGGGDNGGGSGGAGSSSGSGSSNSTSPPAPTTVAPPNVPTVKITKAAKKSSTATTAKFKFTATPAAGATFECKLDGKKWAKCKSPKTYKRLEPGRHTFQVRASVPGAPASKPTKFQFTVKS